MFTGLVQECEPIRNISSARQGGLTLTIEKPACWGDLLSGESIAVSGVCLTLESFSKNEMHFFVGPETLNLTTLGRLNLNEKINLERSLRLGDRLGGHMVSGHVDAVARVQSIQSEGECRRLTLLLPDHLSALVVNKGSLCVNGVSLTINAAASSPEGLQLEFCLIPETLSRTNLSELRAGNLVNIECDQTIKTIVHYLRGLPVEELLKGKSASFS